MSSKTIDPIIGSAIADQRKIPAVDEEEKAPSAEKPADSLEEADTEIPNTSFPFTPFSEPKPQWKGQLYERPIWPKFFSSEFEYQKFKSEQKTPERMEELRTEQIDKFKDHLWSIQPSYMPGDMGSAIVDIQRQIIKNIENTQGISRFDVFTYSPEIFDRLEINSLQIQGALESDEINLGRMSSDQSKLKDSIKIPDKSKDSDIVTKAIIQSLRERLFENMIDTEEHYRETNSKKLNFISSEYMLGRLIQNMACNLDLCQAYEQALLELGCSLENECEKECDLERGYCGRCRQAACMMDSISTNDLPTIAYGLRFDYGAEKQVVDKEQIQYHLNKEMVLNGDNWEIRRPQITYNIGFGGKVEENEQGQKVWEPEQLVEAVAYDIPIPGFQTRNTNILRLFRAEAIEKSIEINDADKIDRAFQFSKKLTQKILSQETSNEWAIRQQFFLVSASIQDMLENFKKQQLNIFLEEMRNVRRARSSIREEKEKASTSSEADEFEVQVQTDLFEQKYIKWEELPQFNQVHFTEQIPALAIVELLRILIDQENLEFDRAFNGIVSQMFSCSIYNLKEKLITVEILQNILPRHLELIYLINFHLIEKLKIDYPDQGDRYSRMSLIEESHPKSVRMDKLILHSCDKIQNQNESDLESEDFKDYHADQVHKIIPGVSPRRWLCCSNPDLASLITRTLKCNDWPRDMQKLHELASFCDDPMFQTQFIEIKESRKKRLADYIFRECGVEVPYDNSTIYDGQMSTPIKYGKRMLMNVLYCIHRYNMIKQGVKIPKRVVIIAGKTHNEQADRIVEMVQQVANIINNDKTIENSLKLVFIPNYNVSIAELIIPALDVFQSISAPGTPCQYSTAPMKALMNGCLILGSRLSSNMDLERVYHKAKEPKIYEYELKEEVEDMPIVIFGLTKDQLQMFQNQPQSEYASQEIRDVVGFMQRTKEIDQSHTAMIEDIVYKGGDFHGITQDFEAYLQCQDYLDQLWMDQQVCGEGFVLKYVSLQIEAISKSWNFSSDRAINQHQLEIWRIISCTVPEPETFDILQ